MAVVRTSVHGRGGRKRSKCYAFQMARSMDDTESGTLTILFTGSTISYVVPSFPIYKAELMEIKVQWEEEDRSLHMFDAFGRNCEDLNHSLPAITEIPYCFDNPFTIDVSVYNKSTICYKIILYLGG